jgi:hypothetical protein
VSAGIAIDFSFHFSFSYSSKQGIKRISPMPSLRVPKIIMVRPTVRDLDLNSGEWSLATPFVLSLVEA